MAGELEEDLWCAMFIVAAEVLLFSNPFLFGDQKSIAVLDLSKIRQGQCLFVIFQTVNHEQIVILWRVFFIRS